MTSKMIDTMQSSQRASGTRRTEREDRDSSSGPMNTVRGNKTSTIRQALASASVRSNRSASKLASSPSGSLSRQPSSKTKIRAIVFDIPHDVGRSELVKAAVALKLDSAGAMSALRSRISAFVHQNFQLGFYHIPELKKFWLQRNIETGVLRRDWVIPNYNEKIVFSAKNKKATLTEIPTVGKGKASSISGKSDTVSISRKTLGSINTNRHASVQDGENEHDMENDDYDGDLASGRQPADSQIMNGDGYVMNKDTEGTHASERLQRLFTSPSVNHTPVLARTSPELKDALSWEEFKEKQRLQESGISELNQMLKALADEMRDIDDVLIEQSAEMVANRHDLDQLERIATTAYTHCEKSRDVLTSAAERIEQFQREGSELKNRIEIVSRSGGEDISVLRQRFVMIQRSAQDALETVKRNHKRLNVAIAGIPMSENSPMEDAAAVLKKLEFVPLRGQYAAWRRYGDREDGLPFDENQPPFLIIRFPTEFVVMDLLKKFNSYRNLFPDRKAPFKVMKDLTKKQVLDAKKVNEIIVKWRKEDGRDYRNRDGVIYLFENNMKIRKIAVEEGPLGPRDETEFENQNHTANHRPELTNIPRIPFMSHPHIHPHASQPHHGIFGPIGAMPHHPHPGLPQGYYPVYDMPPERLMGWRTGY